MADVQIHDDSVSTAPKQYVVPGSAEFVLKAVDATFDGSGAAGAFIPCIEIVSDSGRIVARGMASSVAAGSSAEVSFFPFNRAAATGGSGIQFDTDPQNGDWLWVTTSGSNPNGGAGPGLGITLKDTAGSGIFISSESDNASLRLLGGNVPGEAILLGQYVECSADGNTLDLHSTVTDGGSVSLKDQSGDGGGVVIGSSNGGVFVSSAGKIELTPGTFLQFDGLPTVNPGGTGRVWNNGGVLNVT